MGCLTCYFVTDSEFYLLETWEVNMLNALRRAAPRDHHTAFEIEHHSPTRWTCRHRTDGYTLKVWGWQREHQPKKPSLPCLNPPQ